MNSETQFTAKGQSLSPGRELRILHLEDNQYDREIIQGWLKKQALTAAFYNASSEEEFVKALDGTPFDLILSDITIPGFDGHSALRISREKCPYVPFVFVTGSVGEEAAIETMREGATDYVLKDKLNRLLPAVHRAIQDAEHERKSRQVEEKNREQAALLDKAQDAILVKDMEDRILYSNKSAERIYGWSNAEMAGRKVGELLSIDPAKYEEAQQQILKAGVWKGELRKANRGGNELAIESHWTLVRDERGNPRSVFVIDTDITERKSMELRFLRSQRIDSIGALAGGIAHDLNNALAPVIMSAELLKGCEDEASREKFLDIIHLNASRATDLVKQILSFARGTAAQSGPVQLRHLLDEIAKMIRETFRKSIAFSLKLPARELWRTHGDSTEIHQVLLNLCVNARDAMPEGGRLTVSADNIILDEQEAPAYGAKPGPYVRIAVADTGTGIPPEVLPRIFEPFFTTKKEGAGTGLGLATVAGILKRHGGFMDIHTESGKGTEFKVHFPAIIAPDAVGGSDQARSLPAGKGEMVFVIDDEETLLELTKTLLESFGYRVMTAKDGLRALDAFKEHQAGIDLVITDFDMPHANGVQVIESFERIKPGIPIIVASGTKGDTDKIERKDRQRIKHLAKPYTLENLLAAVNSALHSDTEKSA